MRRVVGGRKGMTEGREFGGPGLVLRSEGREGAVLYGVVEGG